MTTPIRFLLVVTCALAAAVRPARCTSPALPSPSMWSVSSSLETGFGYNDNVLLSHAGEERSAFARSRAELFAFYMPAGRLDYSVLGEAIGTRYFTASTVNHEASAWLDLEPSWRFGERLKLSLPVIGYYRDEVLDVSDTEAERLVAAWKLWGGSVAPTLRWRLHPAWSLEASATGDRRRYDDQSNDSRVGIGELRLKWRPHARVEARLTGTRRWRDFDARTQYNAAGREQLGTHLKIAEREGEVRIEVTWDRAERWKSSTHANVLDYRDNGSGFFDFREKGVAQEIEWKREPWLVRVEGAASRLDFSVQTVGLGLAPPPLVKDHFSASARVERALSRRWTVLGGYTWERRRANEPIESYAVNEGLLGLRWSWEK